MGGPGHWGPNKGEKGACAFSSSLHFSSLEDIYIYIPLHIHSIYTEKRCIYIYVDININIRIDI